MRNLIYVGSLLALALPGWCGPVGPGCTGTPGPVSLFYAYNVGSAPEVLCGKDYPSATSLTPQASAGGTGIDGLVSYGTEKASTQAIATDGNMTGSGLVLRLFDVFAMSGPAGILQLTIGTNYGILVSAAGGGKVEYTFDLETTGPAPFVPGIPGLVQNSDGTLSNNVEAIGYCTAFHPLTHPIPSCYGSYTGADGALVDFTSSNSRAIVFSNTMTVRIPYAGNGYVRLGSELDVNCSADSWVTQSTETCLVDAGHSFYIGGAKLFQLDGVTPMQGGSISAGSSYDYGLPIPGGGPGDPGQAPEPASAALLAVGLGCLYAWRRRAQRI